MSRKRRRESEETTWRRNRGESHGNLPGIMWQMQGTLLTPRVIEMGGQNEFCCQKCCILCQCTSSALKCLKSLLVVKTKMELESHAEKCFWWPIVSNTWSQQTSECFGYDPKIELYASVDATVTYGEPETGQVIIFLIQQVIEMKGLNQHLLCPMQCCMKGILFEVTRLLLPCPSETKHVI